MKLLLFLPKKREVRGGEILSDHNYMKLQEDLSVWRIETTMLRGARGGEKKVTPEDIKSL